MAESFYLKLMGMPELCRSDGRVIRLKVRKHLALLIYFLVEGRELYIRDQLTELLWPEVPEDKGRHSLSMGFSVLRGIFGAGCVLGNHAEVRFVRPPIRLDLDRLEAGVVLGSEAAAELEVDGFLRGFELDTAPGFQHWRDRKHARMLPLVHSGLLQLIDGARRTGDGRRMLALAERLLEIDHLAEEGIRAQMEAFALQGDRVSALRIYEHWKQRLAAELGAAPSELVEGIAARIRRRGIDAAPRPGMPPMPADVSERPFVGRTAEYQTLFEAWEATTQLDTRHVLIHGETGIGKSTLAMRFALAAGLEGAAVARVQCFELEQRIAYGMMGALVRGLLERPAVAGTAPESLAEVARMVPQVRERFPALPPPAPTEGEAARLRFAEGTFALFDAILEQQPLVLIVDDFPRSDEASLSVLHMLLRRASRAQLMVVLTCRPPEPEEPVQAMRIRQGIASLPLRRMELDPLTASESEELLLTVVRGAGREAGFPERRAILQVAGGNPMALELLTQDWLRHGDAGLAVALPAMRSELPNAVFEAAGYDRLVERLLPELTPRTRIVLYLAAVLGPRLNELEGFATLELKPAQVMAALTELAERRILRNTAGRLEFVNELVRARLYLKIPTTTRVRLHDAVADRLLGVLRQAGKVPKLELAWHCIRANRKEEATEFLLAGARDAVTHGAPDEAARALASSLGHLRGRAKAEATLLLAETYQEMAQWQDSLNVLNSLSPDFKTQSVIRETSVILRAECQSVLGLIASKQVTSLVDRLVTFAGEGPNDLRVRASMCAVLLASRERDQELLSNAKRAWGSIPEEDLDPRHLGMLLVSKAMTSYHRRDLDSGLREANAGVRILRTAGVRDSTFARLLTGIGVIAAAKGQYLAGIASLKEAYECASRIDNVTLKGVAAGNLALASFRSGLRHQHLKWARLAWTHAQHSPKGSYDRIYAGQQIALAHHSLGHTFRADQYLESLKDAITDITVRWVLQAALLNMADLHMTLGRERQATDYSEQAWSLSQECLNLGFVGKFTKWSVKHLLQDGRRTHAKDLLAQLAPRLGQLDALDQVEILSCVGMVAGEKEAIPDAGRRGRALLACLPQACARQLVSTGLEIPHC